MKIGIIGCGRQAAKHVAGLKQLPGIEIVVADKVPALARALAEREGLSSVAAADDIFDDQSVDAVVLCVPTPFHGSLIRASLSAGKDFFCEKPLCDSAAEAGELYDLTMRARRIGLVGYVYRHAPVFQKVRSILGEAARDRASPVLGTLAVALMRIGGRGSAALWKHRREEGGGAINEMLVHMLDLAVWFFGPIERAELMTKDLLRPERRIGGRVESANAEDFVLARFYTQSGLPVVIQADLVTPSFTQMVEIQGDNGTAMASIQHEMPQFVFTIDAAGGYPRGRTPLDNVEVNLFDAQMADFVTAVQERRPQQDGTLAASVHVMRALDMIRV